MTENVRQPTLAGAHSRRLMTYPPRPRSKCWVEADWASGDCPDVETTAPGISPTSGIDELLAAARWAVERLDVDDGMTDKEQKTTARRLLAAIAKAESVVA